MLRQIVATCHVGYWRFCSKFMFRNELLSVRLTQDEDLPLLASWLIDPKILRWFPMCDEKEINDAIEHWRFYVKLGAALTVLYDGKPIGMTNLYLNGFKKLRHQCLFSITINEAYRGKGVGTFLMTELIRYAKEKWQIEILHLEVYEGNPAIHLYQRMGFTQYACHDHFVWYQGRYWKKIMMQKVL